MAVKFCSHCNEKIAEDSLVCKFCGMVQDRSEPTGTEKPGPPKESRHSLLIISAIVILLLLALFLIIK
ncbi:hypothetical protein LJK88_43515 [Paenibacillus sp. P26]|nr:hypothetical protein LJK88_43515 [Paenibacillus sp. P26]